MTQGITKSKPREWETRDLHDGRFGLFHNGLCVKVFRTEEELTEWLRARSPIQPDSSKSLNHAIEET